MSDEYMANWAHYLNKNYTKKQLIIMFQKACEQLNAIEEMSL